MIHQQQCLCLIMMFGSSGLILLTPDADESTCTAGCTTGGLGRRWGVTAYLLSLWVAVLPSV